MNDDHDHGRRRHPSADAHGELGLTLDVDEREEITVLTGHGVIDFWNAGPLRERIHHTLRAGPAQLVFDLGDVTFIDSTGLGLLLSVHEAASGRGGWLRLADLQPQVTRILQTTYLDRRLNVYPTVASATGQS